MITLTFRSGESMSFRRDHTLPVLNPDNTVTMRQVHELSPGVLIVQKGIIVWMEFDGERQGLPKRDTSALAVRRVEVRA